MTRSPLSPVASAPSPPTASVAPRVLRPRRLRRAVLWGLLVVLLVVAQSLLLALTVAYESSRAQDHVDELASVAVGQAKRELARNLQELQTLLWHDSAGAAWRADATQLLRARRELVRIERRDNLLRVVEAVESPLSPDLFVVIPRAGLSVESDIACAAARRVAAPLYSRSYFTPLPGGRGMELIDVCLPVQTLGRADGFVVASLSLQALLESALAPEQERSHEFSFVEGDGSRLARSGVSRGAGVYVAQRLLDLPGVVLQLRADGSAGAPRLIPNLAIALVMGLSLALFGLVLVLLRDVRKRAHAERALAEALAFRKAMEDSLITGLRARDLAGNITYANPAFCAMVGLRADQLMQGDTPAYWPPEHVDEYLARQAERLRGALGARDSQQGFETVFVRQGGERFPVMIYEAPLVDREGRHTGWMSAVLDMSAQRRVEEISRQQQERLQATARLATVGEMASLLSHELNQPLAAIASYASGSLNLLDEASAMTASAPVGRSGGTPVHPPAVTPGTETTEMLRQAIVRIAEQAERAGRVIKSVHDFVRRREQSREAVPADGLIDAVLPLARLQARKSGTRIELDLPSPMPRVIADRTMVEQVLLNLARNGIQAMETATPLEDRVLTLRVRQHESRWVEFTVADAGPGIAAEVAAKLFTPFFTTRREGMGLGLSLCRTVIEQHGGTLDFETRTAGADGRGGGSEFRFTLPAANGVAPNQTGSHDAPGIVPHPGVTRLGRPGAD